MAAKTYPITGIPLVPGDDPLPCRQEITSWYEEVKNKYQISLFMRAMTTFKETPIERRLSYFQIAGIHSYPLVDWDGEKAVETPEKTTDPEPCFCNHNRVTFATWHRPYLLLFEQVLYEIMQGLIKGWIDTGKLPDPTEEAEWRKSASRFRLPYWDWARKQGYTGNFGVPQVCTMEKVKIVAPGGKYEERENPLVCFKNPSGKPMGHASMGDNKVRDHKLTHGRVLPWGRCIGTSRYGIGLNKSDSEWINGVNNWKSVNEALINPIRSPQLLTSNLAEMVGRILSPNVFNSWEAFSSTIFRDPDRKAKNGEQINTTGGIYLRDEETRDDFWIPEKPGKIGYKGVGVGHMSDVPVAAFDPIFWFHHGNVDRLMAIWQTFNELLWFNKPDPDVDPTPDSALRPFHHDTENRAWTSNKCRDWRKLNYDYDDVAPAPGLDLNKSEDKIEHVNNLRTYVDKLYPGTTEIIREVPRPGYVGKDQKFTDYIINVLYDRNARDGHAYAILFFLGKGPDTTYVGSVYTFSAPIMDADGNPGCGNCAQQKKQKVMSKALVPLTFPLLTKAAALTAAEANPDPIWQPLTGAGKLDHEKVGHVLADQLSWRFVELGGEEKDAADFPNTVITVLYGTGISSDPDDVLAYSDLPRYGGYKRLEIATKSRLLGYGNDKSKMGLIQDDS